MSAIFGRGVRYTRLNGATVARTRSQRSLKSDGEAEDNSLSSYGAAAQVQNAKSSTIYVFGDADITEEEINTDDAVEMQELRQRGGARSSSAQTHASGKSETDAQPTYLECKICENDTLQSIALKYGCKVAELKRLNNLIGDQDFFALRTVRVPLKRLGLLRDLLAEEQAAVRQSATADGPTPVSIRGMLESATAADFLRRMDDDLQRIVATTRCTKASLPEAAAALTAERIQPLQGKAGSGADCGVRWGAMVVAVVIVTLLAPFVYVVYFEYVRTTDHAH